MQPTPNTIIVIIGPTASGKSDLAIAIAKKYDGEIISADSRQVYRGMDIGTGKVVNDFPVISNNQFPISKQRSADYYSEGIRHHLIDVASPRREYNISHFLRDAKRAIVDIERRGKTIIICGGTHFWVQTLLCGETLPHVKPNKILRTVLEKKSTEELFRMLEGKDLDRAETIDRNNPYRLIRALEIIDAIGKVPAMRCHSELVKESHFTIGEDPSTRRLGRDDTLLIIALNPDKELLRERIRIRLEKRFGEGMIEEVRQLRVSGISWKRLEGFGLEYRYIAQFLQEKISEEAMQEQLFIESWHYAKRQLSFIRHMEKRGLPIHWISDPKEAVEFLSQAFHQKKKA